MTQLITMILERIILWSHYFKYQLTSIFLAIQSSGKVSGHHPWCSRGDGDRNGDTIPIFSFTLLNNVHWTKK